MKKLFLYYVLAGLLFVTPAFAQIKSDRSRIDPMNLIEFVEQFWENSGATQYPFFGIQRVVENIGINPKNPKDQTSNISSFELKVCQTEDEKNCQIIILDFNKIITYEQLEKKRGKPLLDFDGKKFIYKKGEFAEAYLFFKDWKPEEIRVLLLPYMITKFKSIEGKAPLMPKTASIGPKNNSNFVPAITAPPSAQKLIDSSVRVHVEIFGGSHDMTSTGVLYGPCVDLGNKRYRCAVVTAAHVLGGIFFENVKIERYENGVSMGNVPALVAARDYDNDLALLYFETDKPLSAPAVAPDTALRPGMRGLSQVGCPQGDSSLSFLNGFGGCMAIKCATQKDSTMTCSPAGQKGRSGGPLFTPDGKLAGITLATDKDNNKTFYASGDTVAQFVKNNTLPVKTPINPQIPTSDPKKETGQKKNSTPEEIKRLNDRIDRIESQLDAAIKLLQERNK